MGGARWKCRYLGCPSELMVVNRKRTGSKVNQGMSHPAKRSDKVYDNLIRFCETGCYNRRTALGRIHQALTLPLCLVVGKRVTRALVR